jgi:hypothetical protein
MSRLNSKNLVIVLWVLLLAGCSAPVLAPQNITVTLTADGAARQVEIPASSTVQEALTLAGIVVNTLDRSEPPLYTILSQGAAVRLVRVTEEFSLPVEEVIPFEHLEVRSESLPPAEKLLTQKGVNGLRRITTRRLYEDGVKLSESVWDTVVVKESIPEIMVIGIGQSFAPIKIPRRIVYLLGGNAWVMDGNTAERRLVVQSGDLDGRIFTLSPDGEWLLFTRRSTETGEINTLWAARVDEPSPALPINEVDFQVSNVIHYAAWGADSRSVAYSTVEPRATAPGWQANNDLLIRTFNPFSGFVSFPEVILDTNKGGAYGWWGSSFAASPLGEGFLVASPDQLQYLDLASKALSPFIPIIPFETRSDWAWIPGAAWAPGGGVFYYVDHPRSPEGGSLEVSPLFNLKAWLPVLSESILLAADVGMFSYPAPSPFQPRPGEEGAYQVAYLQANTPRQSDTSLYRLMVIDRDGSNRRVLFPPESDRGLDPQRVVWSPEAIQESGDFGILAIYQGNLWLIIPQTGQVQQITGDGLTSRVDWK